MTDEIKKRLDSLFALTERIDERTDDHTEHLENLRDDMRALQAASVEQSRAIATNTERIADSIDKIALKAMERDPFDWRIAIATLACLGIITGLLILAFTGTPLRAVYGNSSAEVGR